jgi:ribosomal protein S9
VIGALLTGPLPLFGCGSSDSAANPSASDQDSGVTPEGGSDGVAGPQLPACMQGDNPPGCAAPVQMKDWDCPDGWVPELLGEGETWAYSICKPPDVPQCADGEVAWLGETACHPIGTVCPTDDFLDEATIKSLAPTFTGKIWYVKPGGTGDGSKTSPLGTIMDAHAKAAAQDIIALSVGTHNEAGAADPALTVTKAVAIVGACVGGTTVAAPSADDTLVTIRLKGTGGALLGNLRVTGKRYGIWITATGPASVNAVEVKQASVMGIGLGAGCKGASMRDVVVRDTQSRQSDLSMGYGLSAQDGAQASLSRGLFERNRIAGIAASSPNTKLDLTEVVVRDTLSLEFNKTFGWGLGAQDGAQITVARALFERNREMALTADGAGSKFDLTDVVVRDTQSLESNSTAGQGLAVTKGAQVTLARGLLDRNRDVGIIVSDSGTKLDLADVVVRDTQSVEKDDSSGIGLQAQLAAQVTLARGLLLRNRRFGLAAASPGTKLDLTDVVVRDTQSQQSEHADGLGLQASEGAQVTVARGRFENNRTAGMVAMGANTTLGLTDIVVDDTQGQESDKTFGVGLQAQEGAMVTLARALFERNRAVGIASASPNTRLDLTDVLIRDMRSQESDKSGGMGLAASAGSQVTLSSARVERSRDFGLLAQDPNTKLDLHDVVVRDTQSQEVTKVRGDGLIVFGGAQGTLARAVFERNRTFGILAMDPDTKLDVTDVVVRDTQSQESDRVAGVGLVSALAAKVTLARGLFERNRYVALVAMNPNTKLDATGLIVRDTRMAECAEIPVGQESSCAGGSIGQGAGSAVVAFLQAEVGLESFSLSGSAQCGILLARDARVTASEGEVHHNVVGLNVQVPGYDLDTILGPTVRFYENGVNLDTTEMPIPDPSKATEAPDGGM